MYRPIRPIAPPTADHSAKAKSLIDGGSNCPTVVLLASTRRPSHRRLMPNCLVVAPWQERSRGSARLRPLRQVHRHADADEQRRARLIGDGHAAGEPPLSVSRPPHPPPIQHDHPANMAAPRPPTYDGGPGRVPPPGDADLASLSRV